MDDIAARYQHLIGQTYGDGSKGTVTAIDVYGPRLVKARLENGELVNVTKLARNPQ